jgi:hypothetical protein
MDVSMGYPMTSDDGVFWQTVISSVSAFLTLLAIGAAIWVGLEPRRLEAGKKDAAARAVSGVLSPLAIALRGAIDGAAKHEHGMPSTEDLKSASLRATQTRDRLQRFEGVWRDLTPAMHNKFLASQVLVEKIIKRLDAWIGKMEKFDMTDARDAWIDLLKYGPELEQLNADFKAA